MEKLSRDILAYIRFLEDKCGLEISLCDLNGTIAPYAHLLAPYTSHRVHFCLLLKKYPALQRACVLQQRRVRQKFAFADSFSGTCYAGMGEYVFRISHGKSYLGFVSVCGYCFRPDLSGRRIRKLAADSGVPERELRFLFDQSVRRKMPDEGELSALVSPLLRMLELFYLAAADRRRQSASDPEKDTLLSALHLYLADNFTNPVTLDKIAQDLHYSKSYLCHYFSDKFHTSIMYYVNGLRIALAEKLLANRHFTITEIAFQTGFNDANYFTHCFRRHTGMTPTGYRRKLQRQPPSEK